MEQFYGDLRTQGYDLACRTMVPDEWFNAAGRYVRIAHVAGITEIWLYPGGKNLPWTNHWRMAWDAGGKTGFQRWLLDVGREIENYRDTA
jgi:hypothetical protein